MRDFLSVVLFGFPWVTLLAIVICGWMCYDEVYPTKSFGRYFVTLWVLLLCGLVAIATCVAWGSYLTRCGW